MWGVRQRNRAVWPSEHERVGFWLDLDPDGLMHLHTINATLNLNST